MTDDAGSPAASEVPASAAYRVELPEFEGPLDLLLHLCKTHELDILQIPIAFVTEKYLEYLEAMQAMSVEIAAEYLVMAATLAYLKARELVPNPEPLEAQGDDGDEAVDPREELIRRLLEYQKYKDAAGQLGGRPIEGRNVFGRGAKLEGPIGPGELAEHSVWKLIESFADILKQAGPKVSHDVQIDRVSLSERINQIVDRLEQGGSFRFDEMVDRTASETEVKHQLVVTLLAILELAKLRVIRVLQDQATEVFFIAHREGASLDAARRAQSTSEQVVEPAADDEPHNQATEPEMEVASMASNDSLVDDSPTEEVRIDELSGGPTEEVPLDESPTEEVPIMPIVPHEGLGAETVRIDPVPVETVTPALGTPTVSGDDDDEEEDPVDKR